MNTKHTITACALLGAAIFTGCQPHQKPRPAPQPGPMMSSTQNYQKHNPVPTHSSITIRQGDGTYNTYTYDHGRRTGVKNTPTFPQ